MPDNMIAAISSDVPTGRRMKGPETFIAPFHRCAFALVGVPIPKSACVWDILSCEFRNQRHANKLMMPLGASLTAGRRRILRAPGILAWFLALALILALVLTSDGTSVPRSRRRGRLTIFGSDNDGQAVAQAVGAVDDHAFAGRQPGIDG